MATSNNGRYEVARASESVCTLRIDDKYIGQFRDSLGRAIRSIAISDNGLIVVSFEATSISLVVDSSIVYIFIESFESLLYSEPWTLGFGSGLAITPNGDKLAIGSPREDMVYIYELNMNENTGSIITSKKSIIGPTSVDFGWKVGFSESGTSIAVASPSTEFDSSQVGAIHIFTLADSAWKPLGMLLYGNTNNLVQIGLGGVSVDDIRAVVAVQDSNLKRTSFMVSTQYVPSLKNNLM